jgi:hypothetical protein
MEISTVEIEVQKYIMSFGADTLIFWLRHFDKVISGKDYPLYRKLERAACEACDITLADMHLFSTTPCVNAKRIISFIACYQLHIRVPSIANLLGLSNRTVNYYIKDAESWISAPMGNKIFVDTYNKVMEKIKS